MRLITEEKPDKDELARIKALIEHCEGEAQ